MRPLQFCLLKSKLIAISIKKDFITMADRNDEVWLFIAEWFDPLPQLKKKYLLKYYLNQNAVEMIDVKTKKMFLKKSPCPNTVTRDDFFLSSRILLYSRELDIVDYGYKNLSNLVSQMNSLFFL